MNFQNVGDYNFNLKLIGKGSFSQVYKGFHNDTFQAVAIKKITKHVDDKYVLSEIELMQSLHHPYILKLHEVIRDAHDIFMILEYCNGGNLKNYIKSKQTEYNSLYIYQIICGLKYLFEKNIIHRDMKPENILIDRNTIKICDFGFAKEIKENDLLNTFCGSPLYMAPEILSFHTYSDKADVWSLGVIIYEIIFKKHPYPCKNKFELINNIKSTAQIRIPAFTLEGKSLCENLKVIIQSCLHKQTHRRICWEDLFQTTWYTSYANTTRERIRGQSQKGSSPDCRLNFEDIFEEEEDFHIHGVDFNSALDGSENDTHSAATRNTRIEYSVKHTSSRRPHYIPASKSVRQEKNSVYNCYEDSRVYSNSAPTNFDNDYLDSLSQNLEDSENGCGYTILGKSPQINKGQSFMKYLGKSVKTIKNIFKL